MSAQQKQADEVLHAIGRRRRVQACYPCAKRKIRCHGKPSFVIFYHPQAEQFASAGGQPCSTCAKRGHPDICFFESDEARPSRAARRSSPEAEPRSSQDTEHLMPGTAGNDVSKSWSGSAGQRSVRASYPTGNDPVASPYSTAANHTPDTTLSAQSGDSTKVGRLSGVAFVRNRLGVPHWHPSHDIRFGLGLENALPSPAPRSSTLQSNLSSSELLEVCPKRREVLRYLYTQVLQRPYPGSSPTDRVCRFFQPLRTHVLPFYPIMSNNDDLELSMYRFLEDADSQLTSSSNDDLVHFPHGRSAEAAFYLASLAVGAQFADLPSNERETQAHDLSMLSCNIALETSSQSMQCSALSPVFALMTFS